jgi:tetratricopeptide (TPR) repeat protein
VSDFSSPIRLAENGAARDSANFSQLMALGAVLYRAGRFEEAVQSLNEAQRVYSPMDEQRTTIAYNSYFLAMAHHRLGHHEEAGHWLAKAVNPSDDWLPQKRDAARSNAVSWNRRLTLNLLGHEAQELLGVKGNEALCREVLAAQRKALGDDHHEVARTAQWLAFMLKSRGDLEGAETHFRQALTIKQKLPGRQEADVAVTLNELGRTVREVQVIDFG